jgi:hypothetical protein
MVSIINKMMQKVALGKNARTVPGRFQDGSKNRHPVISGLWERLHLVISGRPAGVGGLRPRANL